MAEQEIGLTADAFVDEISIEELDATSGGAEAAPSTLSSVACPYSSFSTIKPE